MSTDDAFEVPERLRRRVLPRRDGLLVTPTWELVPDAAERASDVWSGSVGLLYAHLERLADPVLQADVESFRAGGAASPSTISFMLAVAAQTWERTGAEVAVLVDDIVGRVGIVAAAEAMVGLAPERQLPWATGLRTAVFGDEWWQYWPARHAWFDRLRSLLAAAPEADHTAARLALTELRTAGLGGRVMASYLLPSERDWVAADVDEVLTTGITRHAFPLLGCVASAELLDRLTDHIVVNSPWIYGGAIPSLGTPMTLADGVGPDAAPALMRLYHEGNVTTRAKRVAIVDAVACFPTDQALDLLMVSAGDPVCRAGARTAMEWYPHRAVRVAAREDTLVRRGLLRALTVERPDVAEAARAELPTWAAEVVTSVLAAPDAEPAIDVPAILTSPPWASARRRPTVIEGLERPSTVACTWLPRERERWGNQRPSRPERVEEWLAERDSGARAYTVLWALADVDSERAAGILASWRPGRLASMWDAQPVVARHEAIAHDMVVQLVPRLGPYGTGLVMPLESTALTDLAVGWLKRRSLRRAGVEWLRRHPRFAADALIPVAVGRVGKARNDAGAALRLLVELGHRTEVCDAGAAYGETVRAAVDEVLATDPVDLLPARVPKVPTWLSTVLLPPVTTPSGAALSDEALTNLIVMLMLSQPGEPYAGVERAAAGLERPSLGAMACGLYEQWRSAGAPTKDSWVIEALGAVGDEDMVAWVLDEIRRDTADPRAVSLLDVFVMIGTDAALVALRRVAETVRTPRVRTGAEERTQAVADDLGLTADQLADRILPRLGLDDDGVRRVDYGTRSFDVRLDVQMKPVVHDTGGARRKDVPPPGANDDPALAPRAHAAYKQFKKDVRTHGVDQVKRLEHAMLWSRRFDLTELRDVLLPHPLRRPLLQRLVWATFAGDSVTAPCTGTFGIAEDGTLADLDDRTIELAADAVIGIAHPALAGVAFDRWAEVFADYELVQPFLQLARPWQALDDATLATSALTDLAIGIDSRHFLSIDRKGFDRPEAGDGGMIRDMVKQLPGGRSFHLTIEPGVYMGDPTMEPQQAIVAAALRAGPDDDHDPTFADIGPVATSEILVDLASLRS